MINKNNINKFIENSDKKVKNIIKKIFKNTSFITKKYFFKELYKNINNLISFINKKRKKYIYIFLDQNKNNSNYWLFTYLKKYLKNNNLNIKLIIIGYYNLSILANKFNNNDIILFIDDCIYSGHQLGANIANFIDLTKNININIFNNIFILVPFISLNGEKYIKNIYKYNNDTQKYKLVFNKYKNRNKMKNTDKILNKDEINLINEYYPRNKNIIESSTNYFNDKSLIVFFYKIADLQSTINIFYKGLIPNSHNLNIIKNNLDINNLQIIPLFSKCNKSLNINDICPFPPYKKIT